MAKIKYSLKHICFFSVKRGLDFSLSMLKFDLDRVVKDYVVLDREVYFIVLTSNQKTS